MPGNIEVKAALGDIAAAHAVAAGLSGFAPRRIEQTDVFFASPEGRLKLRILGPSAGELIYYQRADAAEARRSEYEVARTSEPAALLAILRRVLRETGTVRKTRFLYLVGQTRIHLDQVEGLGDFLEIEVVMQPGETAETGKRVAAWLLAEFGIGRDRLIAEAYIDLLRGKGW